MELFSLQHKFKTKWKIEKPKQGKRYVIGDIHGYYDTFMALLEQVSLSKTDQLFLLGDYIDRGPKVQELLDEILLLMEKGYSIFPLRGNHEDMCWQAHLKDYDEATLKLPGYKWGKDIIDQKRKILPKYVKLFSKLPYFYELDDFYLVHAGFDFTSTNPFTEYKSMLWVCNEDEDANYLQNKILIHEHSKRSMENIYEKVKKRGPIIGLDNSVYTSKSKGYGSLVCLNLDSFELFVQEGV
jgi:serine/threonine protein phosphatase 1